MEQIKPHAHFCADCGNDWLCECKDGISQGEISKECYVCFYKRFKAGFDEAELGG